VTRVKYIFCHGQTTFGQHKTNRNSLIKKASLILLWHFKKTVKTQYEPNPALPKTQSKHHFELITIAFSHLQTALEQLVFFPQSNFHNSTRIPPFQASISKVLQTLIT
jgi:hypothetical protein